MIHWLEAPGELYYGDCSESGRFSVVVDYRRVWRVGRGMWVTGIFATASDWQL